VSSARVDTIGKHKHRLVTGFDVAKDHGDLMVRVDVHDNVKSRAIGHVGVDALAGE
jgi:hypothetical protein